MDTPPLHDSQELNESSTISVRYCDTYDPETQTCTHVHAVCSICGEGESRNPAFAGQHRYGPVADHDFTTLDAEARHELQMQRELDLL